MANKFEFPFNKIVGASGELKKDIEEEWHENIGDIWEDKRKEFAEYERPLSEEERKLIERTQKYVDKVALRYGGNPKPIPPESIFVLKPGAVFEITEGKFREGYNNCINRTIVVEWGSSDIDFATTLAHEMFHLKGFDVLRFSAEEGRVRPYRSGMSMRSKDNQIVYFNQIEEALVSEAVKMVIDEYFKSDHCFSKEIKQVETIKKWLNRLLTENGYSEEKRNIFLEELYSLHCIEDIIEVLEGNENDDYKLGFLHAYVDDMLKNGEVILQERKEERDKLNKLVDMILKYSNGKYKNRQEIIDVFFCAHFSGKLLPLAKMLEKSVVKGAFRAVANDFALFKETEDMSKQNSGQ
jgi:hypothetical protein